MTKLACPSCGTVYSRTFEPKGDELRCDECGTGLLAPWKLKPRKPLKQQSDKRKAQGRRPGLKRGKGFAASKAQQEKVRGLPCLGCGREESETVAIDPAHFWPRSKGGCDSPLCVGPLCRLVFDGSGCHRLFDEGRLDLLPKLIDRGYHAELAHMLHPHGLSPTEQVRRLSGDRWEFVEKQGVAA